MFSFSNPILKIITIIIIAVITIIIILIISTTIIELLFLHCVGPISTAAFYSAARTAFIRVLCISIHALCAMPMSTSNSAIKLLVLLFIRVLCI